MQIYILPFSCSLCMMYVCCSGGKKGREKGGGGGRGVRGVDFGLGIGYNPEPCNVSVPSRSVAVNSLKTGMMAQFKSSFVAASSNSQNISSIPVNKRPAFAGFVSGGTIGGDVSRTQTTNAVSFAPTAVINTFSQNSGENANQNNSERLNNAISPSLILP